MIKKITLLILLCIATTIHSQITYHDITPDVVFTAADPPGEGDNLFPIDLNTDGTKEFDFRWDAWNAGPNNLIWFIHFYSQPAQSSTRQFITTTPASMLKPLQFGDAITPAQTYTNGLDPMLSTTGNNNFIGLGDRYIGFRATIAGTVYYGWIRVSLNNLTTTIKDYAYTTNANGLNAGQMNLSVQENAFQNSTVLTPNPSRDNIVVENDLLSGEVFHYTLMDTSGKKLASGAAAFGEKIYTSGIATGNYLLKLEKDRMSVTLHLLKH